MEYQPRRVGEVDRNFATYDLAKQALGYVARHHPVGRHRPDLEWYQEHVFPS